MLVWIGHVGEPLDVFSYCPVDVLNVISAQVLSGWVVNEGDHIVF